MPNPGNPTVIVDDRSALIKYTGDWGKDGIPLEFQGTTSTSKTQGNTAEFSFEGTKIVVYGTYNADLDSSWNFAVDRTITGSFKAPATIPAGGSQNAIHHQALYTSPDLPAGRHTLVITQASTTAASHLFLDYLVYTPTPESSSKDLQYLVDDGNAAAKFENWGSGQDDRNVLHTFRQSSGNGAKVTLAFEGIGVSVIGDVPRHVLANTMATISIDGGPVTEFKPNGQILDEFTVQQEIYKSAQLTQNNHTLTLTTVGDEPLRLDYFLVTPGEITRPTPSPSSTTSSATSSSTSTRTSTVTQTSTGSAAPTTSNSATPANTNTGGSSNGNVAAIAGGTVAGIVGLALIFAIFMVWRKRRRNKMDLDGLDALSLTSERYTVQPFTNGPPSGGVGTSYHNYPPSQSQYAPSAYNYAPSTFAGSNHAGYGAGAAAGYGAVAMANPSSPEHGYGQPYSQNYGQDNSRSVTSQPYGASSTSYSIANPGDEERPAYSRGSYAGPVGDVKRRPSPPAPIAATSTTALSSAYDGVEEPATLAYDQPASPGLPNPHYSRPPGYTAS